MIGSNFCRSSWSKDIPYSISTLYLATSWHDPALLFRMGRRIAFAQGDFFATSMLRSCFCATGSCCALRPFAFSPHLTFFSNHSCHCSPVKLLEMLFSTTPCVLVSNVRRPSSLRDKTYIEQHRWGHMNTQKSIHLFHTSHDILPNEKGHAINLP